MIIKKQNKNKKKLKQIIIEIWNKSHIQKLVMSNNETSKIESIRY